MHIVTVRRRIPCGAVAIPVINGAVEVFAHQVAGSLSGFYAAPSPDFAVADHAVMRINGKQNGRVPAAAFSCGRSDKIIKLFEDFAVFIEDNGIAFLFSLSPGFGFKGLEIGAHEVTRKKNPAGEARRNSGIRTFTPAFGIFGRHDTG